MKAPARGAALDMLQFSGVVTWVGLALGFVVAPACSLIFDTDGLPGSARDGSDDDDDDDDDDGDDDASTDAGQEADAADPDALDFQLVPAELFEGEGSAFDPEDEALVRAIPIVLRGQNLSDDMTITLDGAGFDSAPVEEFVVSPDGRWAAFSLRVPVLPDLAQGMNDTIQVRVESFENVSRNLTVRGLDAFERSGDEIDTDDIVIRARYSHVALSGDIVARGSAPLRLVATAGITVSGSLRADGSGRTPGAGGCAGGTRGVTPPCGASSGSAGGTISGGGGGGFGTAGAKGAPTNGAGGAGGATASDTTLVPLPPASGSASRGAGGGGGGTLLDLTGGTAGGGGGGVLELTTRAVLRLEESAIVSASGGAGTLQGAVCLLGGGSGGSGSGGAILLRAGASLAVGQGAEVRATGGPQVGIAGCFGGAGGAGRIRIDSADPVDNVVDQPDAALGPMIAGDAPVVTRNETVALTVRGANSASYNLYLGEANQPAGSIAIGGAGLGSADVTLEPGSNLVCVSGSDPAVLSYAEAKNCLSIAYVPSD